MSTVIYYNRYIQIKKNNNLELESRYKFKDVKTFLNVLHRIQKDPHYESEKSPIFTTIKIAGNKRYIFQHSDTDDGQNVLNLIEIDTKTRLNYEIVDNIKVTISEEIKSPVLLREPNTFDLIRSRERYTFKHIQLPFFVLLTRTKQDTKHDEYELEVEYAPNDSQKLHPISNELINQLINLTKQFMFSTTGTNTSTSSRAIGSELIMRYNQLIKHKKNPRYIHYPYSKPIDIDMKDLVWNKIKNMAISEKADGIRTIIWLDNTGTYTVTSSIKRINHLKWNEIVILDCEYIENKQKYFVFDVLVSDGVNVSEKPLYDKIPIITNIITQTKHKLLDLGFDVELKPYYFYNSIEEYQDAILNVKKDEGIVFQDIYNHTITLKFKHILTVDFVLMSNNRLGYKNSNNKIVHFDLASRQPRGLENSQVGDIVEMKYESGGFVFYRNRNKDKNEPNHESVVMSIFDKMKHPITIETLSLMDLSLTINDFTRHLNSLISNYNNVQYIPYLDIKNKKIDSGVDVVIVNSFLVNKQSTKFLDNFRGTLVWIDLDFNLIEQQFPGPDYQGTNIRVEYDISGELTLSHRNTPQQNQITMKINKNSSWNDFASSNETLSNFINIETKQFENIDLYQPRDGFKLLQCVKMYIMEYNTTILFNNTDKLWQLREDDNKSIFQTYLILPISKKLFTFEDALLNCFYSPYIYGSKSTRKSLSSNLHAISEHADEQVTKLCLNCIILEMNPLDYSLSIYKQIINSREDYLYTIIIKIKNNFVALGLMEQHEPNSLTTSFPKGSGVVFINGKSIP